MTWTGLCKTGILRSDFSVRFFVYGLPVPNLQALLKNDSSTSKFPRASLKGLVACALFRGRFPSTVLWGVFRALRRRVFSGCYFAGAPFVRSFVGAFQCDTSQGLFLCARLQGLFPGRLALRFFRRAIPRVSFPCTILQSLHLCALRRKRFSVGVFEGAGSVRSFSEFFSVRVPSWGLISCALSQGLLPCASLQRTLSMHFRVDYFPPFFCSGLFRALNRGKILRPHFLRYWFSALFAGVPSVRCFQVIFPEYSFAGTCFMRSFPELFQCALWPRLLPCALSLWFLSVRSLEGTVSRALPHAPFRCTSQRDSFRRLFRCGFFRALFHRVFSVHFFAVAFSVRPPTEAITCAVLRSILCTLNCSGFVHSPFRRE